jgi:uncharacterized protein (TIGR00299 family) protein
MPNIAYFDCFSGCSGDMVLGALLDAGLSLEALKAGLHNLNLQGYRLSAEKVLRSSIAATKFNVVIDPSLQQPHRSLSDILTLIGSSELSDRVKQNSSAVFRRLGEVEARLHGVDIEQVHFHEIGGVDSIVDIVGAALAFEILNIKHFYCSSLPLGKGSVSTAHGVLPVPAPATLELLARTGAPTVEIASPAAPQGELVTPTGAALVTAFAEFRRPQMVLHSIGQGAGSKDFPGWPNILRIWLGSEPENPPAENLVLLETNIDDMNPQIYGYLMDKLFAEKAADVWFTPIQMKKNRPAIMLSVLLPSFAEAKITEIILRETPTLGLRVRPVARHTAQREIREIDSSLGKVRIKIKLLSGQVLNLSPEYEDCRRIASERNIPLREVYRIIEEEANRILS